MSNLEPTCLSPTYRSQEGARLQGAPTSSSQGHRLLRFVCFVQTPLYPVPFQLFPPEPTLPRFCCPQQAAQTTLPTSAKPSLCLGLSLRVSPSLLPPDPQARVTQADHSVFREHLPLLTSGHHTHPFSLGVPGPPFSLSLSAPFFCLEVEGWDAPGLSPWTLTLYCPAIPTKLQSNRCICLSTWPLSKQVSSTLNILDQTPALPPEDTPAPILSSHFAAGGS